jgi:hypothetical protein
MRGRHGKRERSSEMLGRAVECAGALGLHADLRERAGAGARGRLGERAKHVLDDGRD